MNLRAILFWKILIGISLVIILWWSWDPAYSNYDKYSAEVKKEKKAKKGLGDKEEEQIQTLEKMYQEKRDNKFIIADNPTALSRVIKIQGLEDDYQSSSNTVKTLIVYGKEPKLKAIVLHEGKKHTVEQGDSIAEGKIKIIDSEKLVFIKDGIEYTHYYNKK